MYSGWNWICKSGQSYSKQDTLFTLLLSIVFGDLIVKPCSRSSAFEWGYAEDTVIKEKFEETIIKDDNNRWREEKQLCRQPINFSYEVKCFRVTLEKGMKWNAHIKRTCRRMVGTTNLWSDTFLWLPMGRSFSGKTFGNGLKETNQIVNSSILDIITRLINLNLRLNFSGDHFQPRENWQTTNKSGLVCGRVKNKKMLVCGRIRCHNWNYHISIHPYFKRKFVL